MPEKVTEASQGVGSGWGTWRPLGGGKRVVTDFFKFLNTFFLDVSKTEWKVLCSFVST